MSVNDPLPDVTIEQLPERLREAAARVGWTTLMPVQARGIPYLLAARDMMIQARTGSGKTGAFLLPMLERLDPRRRYCQALILVPTRELARQVGQEAERLCGDAGFRSVVVYGGVGYDTQIDALKQGAQIVVGTPGRVLDHLLKRTFTLDHIEMLLDDYYQQTLHAPLPQPAAEPAPARPGRAAAAPARPNLTTGGRPHRRSRR